MQIKIHTVQLNLEDLHAGTFHMDAQEFGAYVRLFLACYQSSDLGLPNDDVRLARIARCSMKVWNRIKAVVVDKFVDKDGRLFHERVEKDALAYSERSATNRANRLKGINTTGQVVKEPSTNGRLPTTYQNPNTKNPLRLPRESGSFSDEKMEGVKEEAASQAPAPVPSSPFSEGFNIERFLDDEQRAKARGSAPGWDLYFLMRAFNGFVIAQKIVPRAPVAMFLTWIPKFTKGKKPS